MRSPASPYALENVRSTITFGRSIRESPETAAGSSTNSTYASSSTTATSSGTRSRNASTSICRSAGPVGLFGVQSRTATVAGEIAASMASRSCSYAGVNGTGTPVAPLSWVAIGYASKLRNAYTTSAPGRPSTLSRWKRTATDPVPNAIRSGATPSRPASAAVRVVTAMSG